MQASRLLSILMLLQSRGRMSAFALARELEVSVRTVYRDVDSLSAAGVPVYGDRGRSGGFQLREGWRTQLTGLTTGEARALLMTGLPGPAKALGLGEAAASAHLKLLAALPADWRSDAERVGARFHLDPVDWFRGAAPAEQLRVVAEAVWGERRLRMRYESWTSVSERIVDPLGLVLKGGAWYLVARHRREPRTYRVAAIEHAQVLDERFVRPPSFDLAAFWGESTRRFEEGVYRDFATLRASPVGLNRLRGFSPIVAQAADRTAGRADRRGWRQVTVPIESVEHAAREMLRLGDEAVVLEPAALRDALRATVAQMLASYDGASASLPRRTTRTPRRRTQDA
ncbi:MAG TPA: YafY family protein [Burkholderiaceae bacterium]